MDPITLEDDYRLEQIADRGCDRWGFYHGPDFNLCACAPCRASVELHRRKEAADVELAALLRSMEV